MIKSLFLDLDDTILDFHKAERLAIAKTFRNLGLEPTEAVLEHYHQVNRLHWEALERGEMTRDQVLVGRFQVLFQDYGMEVDPVLCARSYEQNLGVGHYFLPGAEETVKRLSRTYDLYLASNGTASVQHSRLTSAGLYPYFKEVFISQNLGANKPSREYFEACYQKIPGFHPGEAMMVGDSLTSDILGGIRGGMHTCWVNPEGRDPGDIRPDYTIKSIAELPGLLETL